jgi:hypothetical protein
MRENPRPKGLLQEKDIEYVLQRFEEEYNSTLIRKRLVIDTGEETIDDTFAKFVREIQPHLTDDDRLRILGGATPTRRAAKDADIEYFRREDLRRILSIGSTSRQEDE